MSDKDKTVAEQLMDIADNVILFNDPSGTPWTRAHGRCYPVRSTHFKTWLQREFYRLNGKTPHSQALQNVLDQVAGKAMFDSGSQEIHVRVATVNGKIIIDLGTDTGIGKIEIDPGGWQAGTSEVVNFWRPPGMKPLPEPQNGDIGLLKDFINVESDADFRLVVSWLLAALNPEIACPILILQGEQGSAKSTAAKFLRCLVDPNGALIRSAPKDERELIIQANNSRVLCLDNLSGLKGWLSDALCRICTGTGFSTRRLYTNDEEQIFTVQRPIILNGIDDIATRGDLLDRSIVLNFPAISQSKRKDERRLWEKFDQVQPKIFGALLNGITQGLANDVSLNSLPRMADFAEWVTRCEGAFEWKKGTLLADYNQNRGQAVETGLDSDILATAIRKILLDTNEYANTATALIDKIKQVSPEVNERYLPTTRTLKSRLTRLAPALRQVGITWTRRHTEQGNEYVLEKSGNKASEASVPSEISSKRSNGHFETEATLNELNKQPESFRKASAQKQPSDTTNGNTEATEATEATEGTLSKEEFENRFNSYNEAPF